MKKILLSLIIIHTSIAYSKEIDCGSNEAKELIGEIAIEQQLYLDYIFTHSDQFKNTDAFKQFMKGAKVSLTLALGPIPDPKQEESYIEELLTDQRFTALTHTHPIFKQFFESYRNTASSKLEDIILTKKENDTGTLLCKGKLSVSVDEWGGAEAIKNYKIEKTSEGKLYATLYK